MYRFYTATRTTRPPQGIENRQPVSFEEQPGVLLVPNVTSNITPVFAAPKMWYDAFKGGR